jgi:hypothetical protein
VILCYGERLVGTDFETLEQWVIAAEPADERFGSLRLLPSRLLVIAAEEGAEEGSLQTPVADLARNRKVPLE